MTPMMEQYLSIKAQHKDDILMFRLGDFFEIFFEDAITASKALDIALTGRDCGMAERAPMCGVPAHAVDGYVARLVEKGYRVAMCDQVEDAKHAKGIVKREVVRVITPGTVTDANLLDEGRHNYIAAIHKGKAFFGVAVADITTGLFMATAIHLEEEDRGTESSFRGSVPGILNMSRETSPYTVAEQKLIDEITRLNPAELLLPEGFTLARVIENAAGCKATTVPAWTFQPTNAAKFLSEHFGTMHLEGFGLKNNAPQIPAAGALLAYLAETQKSALSQITTLKIYSHQLFMLLDASSRRNLELTSQARERVKKGSLLWVLDSTKTAMGARLLRSWVELPLMNTEEINKRLDSVEEWVYMPIERAELREYLHSIHDLERLMARLCTRYCTARDMASLGASLALLPQIERLLQHVKAAANNEIRRTYDDLSDICAQISAALVETPPATVKEGGMIRAGYTPELDKLLDIKQNAKNYLVQLETREKQQTGITSLKVRFNKVFGYYIEVTAANLAKVPAHYVRRQTLANCERFVTEELKTLEETLLGADEKIHALEFELFDTLRREVVENMARVQFACHVLATLDVLQSLAEIAEQNQYVKPKVTNSTAIHIKDGRHPVVERLLPKGVHSFVPNDTEMDSTLSIITGPNMAGKSTYMRQVALIVLMAQIGSFVPADAAEIGVVDRIFTRVGASDDLATGQSTFMVEMTEVANILNNATSSSLVILDEIGRGTSTFDGLAIAWAVLEYMRKLGSKTLFATHYHELTQLEGQIGGVLNYCFTVMNLDEVMASLGEDIVFLRRLTRGEAGQSYGLHVARLAGLPSDVLDRATDVLAQLNAADITKTTSISKPQQHPPAETKAAQNSRKLTQAISAIDIENMTPLEAMATLGRLKEIVELNGS